jgi:hypothetical protein
LEYPAAVTPGERRRMKHETSHNENMLRFMTIADDEAFLEAILVV